MIGVEKNELLFVTDISSGIVGNCPEFAPGFRSKKEKNGLETIVLCAKSQSIYGEFMETLFMAKIKVFKYLVMLK